jgi:hypothetical protein
MSATFSTKLYTWVSQNEREEEVDGLTLLAIILARMGKSLVE